MLVEVCANSLDSALNAQEAGADRIELCAELGVGGITPSHGMIALVKKRLSIPIHVLIRPRSGHFTYDERELEVMIADIAFCKSIGVEGIVTGALTAGFELDEAKTAKLIAKARPLHVTFHRAFDWVKTPVRTLAQLENVGVRSVLTSGQCQTAEQGLMNLRQWQMATKMTIMVGGGVHPENVLKFKEAGLRAVHLSGTTFHTEIDFKNSISMLSEKHLKTSGVAVTNENVIRQTVQAIRLPLKR